MQNIHKQQADKPGRSLPGRVFKFFAEYFFLVPLGIALLSLPVLFLAFFPIQMTSIFFGIILAGSIFAIPYILIKGALGYDHKKSFNHYLDFLLQFSAIMCLYALSRAVGDIIVIFWMNKLYSGAEPHATILYPYIFFGSLLTACALIMTTLDFFWRNRQIRQIENFPTSKIRSAALGLVELKGRAQYALETNSPYIISSMGLGPFYIEDDTGRVLVDPGDSKPRDTWHILTHISHMVFGLGAILGIREVVLRKRRIPEGLVDDRYIVLPGDTLYVFGNLEVNPEAPPGATGAAKLVVRPKKRPSLGEGVTSVLSGGLEYLNVFFITDTDEDTAKKLIAQGRLISLGVGLAVMMLGVFLLFEGITGLSALKHL